MIMKQRGLTGEKWCYRMVHVNFGQVQITPRWEKYSFVDWSIEVEVLVGDGKRSEVIGKGQKGCGGG